MRHLDHVSACYVFSFPLLACAMPLWKRLWLLFSVIWVVVAGLNVATILALGNNPPAKAVKPALLMLAVPAVGYLIAWLFFRRGGKKGAD
jgi:hypothetical protein